MNLQLRQATANDLDQMKTLFVETIKNTCKDDYSPKEIEVWTSSVKRTDRWLSVLKEQFVLLAELEGQLVGFGTLENGSYLDFLYVHHLHLRKGIAHQLYEGLKQESIKRGFETLSSDVSKTARPFFENKGFRVVRENQNERDGVILVNYHMQQ